MGSSSLSPGYMGIGQLMSPDVVYNMPFRWSFYLQPNCPKLNPVDVWFVKTAGLPKYDAEEIQLDFLNAKAWIPGKITYSTIDVTYLDVAKNRVEAANLYAYIAALSNFNNPNRIQGSSVQDYTATGTIVRFDGCGTAIESWYFTDLWTKAVDFGGGGGLDYSKGTEPSTVTLTFRYSQFSYTALCGTVPFTACCTSCPT
jgi:hypothetical protein